MVLGPGEASGIRGDAGLQCPVIVTAYLLEEREVPRVHRELGDWDDGHRAGDLGDLDAGIAGCEDQA